MSSEKVTSGNLKINLGPFNSGNVTSGTGSIGQGLGKLVINGNLEVLGTTININPVESLIADAFFTAAGNQSGTYANATLPIQGLLTITSNVANTFTYAGIRYNNAANTWQISSNTSIDGSAGTWSSITSEAAGANTQIQYNYDDGFGASSALTFDQSTNILGLDGQINLVHLASTPANVANNTVFYANTSGSGGTGLYFVDADNTQDELVSKAKAIVYAIIF